MKKTKKANDEIETLMTLTEKVLNTFVDIIGWNGFFVLIKRFAENRGEHLIAWTFEGAEKFLDGKL